MRLSPCLSLALASGLASAVLAAVRRRRTSRRIAPAGLAAFEDAPCYRELVEEEERKART